MFTNRKITVRVAVALIAIFLFSTWNTFAQNPTPSPCDPGQTCDSDNQDSPPCPDVYPGTFSSVNYEGRYCVGACGRGCSQCERSTVNVCNPDLSRCCTYQIYICNAHEGCIIHDQCIKQCNDAFSGRPINIFNIGWDMYTRVRDHFSCLDQCSQDCYENYTRLQCWSWLFGWVPFDGVTFVYSDRPTQTDCSRCAPCDPATGTCGQTDRPRDCGDVYCCAENQTCCHYSIDKPNPWRPDGIEHIEGDICCPAGTTSCGYRTGDGEGAYCG